MNNRRFFYVVFLLGISFISNAQSKKESGTKPKLVIGIVVDQMRSDYLSRYWDRFSAGGFKRLVADGFYFKNAHFNYVPTYTGPGHCSIYTGTTPRNHGIIANDWFVKNNSTSTYCVEDTSMRTMGSEGKAGWVSPKKQLSSTIGDELKMSSNQQAKVFAIALKDRSAVLPAGHAANGAYWFEDATGNFVSSTFYCRELPTWVKDFNAKKLPGKYLEKGWNTMYPIETYSKSIADDNRYEGTPFKDKPTFPYSFRSFLEKNNVAILKGTPFGNSITKDLAIACILNEKLGKGAETDLLSISFSSTDMVAHTFGPRAVEIEDVYLRLDKDIEELLNTLDRALGKGNYTVFLTADHGGADVPNHLLDHQIPAGYINEKLLSQQIKQFFKTNYGDTLLFANMSNEQVFLNEVKLTELKLTSTEVEEKLCHFLIGIKGIAEAYPSAAMKYGSFERTDQRSLVQNGYNFKLSGNVCIVLQAAWMAYAEKGTTHGSSYNYDTHVPVIFYGKGIKKGESFSTITITQIAPTVCELLHINQPNACTSEPLNDYFK